MDRPPCCDSPVFFFFLTFIFLRRGTMFSNILKRAHILPRRILHHTSTKRKKFLLAPLFAYDQGQEASQQKLKHVLFDNQTKIRMSRYWLQHYRSFHTSIPPHSKPTSKEELLAQARGFFERLKIRIKYPLMRQIRPWTLNDVTALFSWLFLGHTVWLLLGTTSFVSLILWLANSLQFQGK